MIQTSTITNNHSSNISTLNSSNFESSIPDSFTSSTSSKMTLKGVDHNSNRNDIETTIGKLDPENNQKKDNRINQDSQTDQNNQNKQNQVTTRPKSSSNVSTSSIQQQQLQQQTRQRRSNSNNEKIKILDINFNQDQGCFAIGHENGFLVYNTDPIDLRVKRNFNNNKDTNNNIHYQNQIISKNISNSILNNGSGIGHITMLHRTNYLALVGGGLNPKFPPNKLIIWDDLKRKISLSLEFNKPIKRVLLSRIKIIIVLEDQIHIYSFTSPPKKLMTFETSINEFGLADLSSIRATTTTSSSTEVRPTIQNNKHNSRGSYGSVSSNSSNNSITSNTSITSLLNQNSYYNQQQQQQQLQSSNLAFPGKAIGQIQIVDIGQQTSLSSIQKSNTTITTSSTTPNTNLPTQSLNSSIIKAHKSQIRNLCLNKEGTMIASASIQGTIIRIHCTKTTTLVYEFRRGIDKADITSLKFNHNSSKLAVLSDKYTLHIFNLQSSSSATTTTSNESKLLKFLPNPIIPQYFKSKWSNYNINTSKFHSVENELDRGEIGWINNYNLCIIWKNKRIWEKYSIIESDDDEAGDFKIIRSSWKSLDFD
ncbi:HSV2 [Candida pseudojiufengensis]|uniref:HSV2 n=1 Tax=Candida pseudojiufengensis TaxID=497109 RepID=UPI0022257A94|nr:HSV2 [Candida pseudojiufengensis]KAI5965957.1 HSV2 [Candida pseudojiufengensis]